MPLPSETELRVQLSPVPTHITSLFVGSSATAPIDFTGCLSKTGLKLVPPSSDFHTPPEAEPTSRVTLPSFSCRPATAAMRPDMVAEPMLRTPSPEIAALSKLCAAAGAAMPRAADASRIERSILLAPLRRLGGTSGRFLAPGGRLLRPRFALRLHRGIGRRGGGLGERCGSAR